MCSASLASASSSQRRPLRTGTVDRQERRNAQRPGNRRHACARSPRCRESVSGAGPKISDRIMDLVQARGKGARPASPRCAQGESVTCRPVAARISHFDNRRCAITSCSTVGGHWSEPIKRQSLSAERSGAIVVRATKAAKCHCNLRPRGAPMIVAIDMHWTLRLIEATAPRHGPVRFAINGHFRLVHVLRFVVGIAQLSPIEITLSLVGGAIDLTCSNTARQPTLWNRLASNFKYPRDRRRRSRARRAHRERRRMSSSRRPRTLLLLRCADVYPR